jgi:hypothetical protein
MYTQAGGKMPRRLTIGIVLLTVFAVSAFVLRPVGELAVIDSRIASAHEGTTYDPQVWRSGDQVKRGPMVADLARRHHFIGMRPDSVHARLGPSDCYYVQDGWPCYQLRLGHSDFQLVFPVDESRRPLRVVAVQLNKR